MAQLQMLFRTKINFPNPSVHFREKLRTKRGIFIPFSQRSNSTMDGRISMIFCILFLILKFFSKKIFPRSSTRDALSNKIFFPNPSIRSRAMPRTDEQTDNEISTPYSKQKRFALLWRFERSLAPPNYTDWQCL